VAREEKMEDRKWKMEKRKPGKVQRERCKIRTRRFSWPGVLGDAQGRRAPGSEGGRYKGEEGRLTGWWLEHRLGESNERSNLL